MANNQMILEDGALHRVETTILVALIALAFIAALSYLGWKVGKLENALTDIIRRERDPAPDCMRFCANANDECYGVETECYRYERKPIQKHFDPQTGEIWRQDTQ